MYNPNNTLEVIREEFDFLYTEEVDDFEVYSQGLAQIQSRLDSEESTVESVRV